MGLRFSITEGRANRGRSALLLIGASVFIFVPPQLLPVHDARGPAPSGKAWQKALVDSLARTADLPPPPPSLGASEYAYWLSESSAALQVDRLEDSLRKARNPSSRQLLGTADLAQLKRLGLTDPVRQLREDLLAHPELIPLDGSLGDSRFSGDEIVLLNPFYAWCGFTNQGAHGSMLLEFAIADSGKILWKPLWPRSKRSRSADRRVVGS